MEDFYEGLKKELLSKREQLRSLTRQPKIQGDYHEALVRDFVGRFIDDSLSVKHGLIYDRKGQRSRECDVIIYEKGKKPLFESGDLVIVNEEDVRFVIQVKSKLTSRTLKDAIENLREVKKLNNQIMCWIVGFDTKLLLKTLYLTAWRSGVVQYLQIFCSDRKNEDKTLLSNQMMLFVEAVRRCRSFQKYGYTNDFVIHQKDRFRIALSYRSKEEKITQKLSRLYSLGFENYWREVLEPLKNAFK
jgi:hypothetical protein